MKTAGTSAATASTATTATTAASAPTASSAAVAILRRRGKTSFSVGGSPVVVGKKHGDSPASTSEKYEDAVAAAAAAVLAFAAENKDGDLGYGHSHGAKDSDLQDAAAIEQSASSSGSGNNNQSPLFQWNFDGAGPVSSTAATPQGTVAIRKSFAANHSSSLLSKVATERRNNTENYNDDDDDGHIDVTQNRSASPALSEMSHDDDYDEAQDAAPVHESKGAAGCRDGGKHISSPPTTSSAGTSSNPANAEKNRHRASSKSDESNFVGFISGVGADEVYQGEGCDNGIFRFRRGEVIGEGSFGRVYRSKNLTTGEYLAVKQIVLADGTEAEVKSLKKEIQVMWDLKHDNIVRSVFSHYCSSFSEFSSFWLSPFPLLCMDFARDLQQ
jgi:hypothetical protein